MGVAERVAGRLPDSATVEIRKAQREGRVYIDVLQNALGKHVVSPYALARRPGSDGVGPVAMVGAEGEP